LVGLLHLFLSSLGQCSTWIIGMRLADVHRSRCASASLICARAVPAAFDIDGYSVIIMLKREPSDEMRCTVWNFYPRFRRKAVHRSREICMKRVLLRENLL
jgi:hypothetical protein